MLGITSFRTHMMLGEFLKTLIWYVCDYIDFGFLVLHPLDLENLEVRYSFLMMGAENFRTLETILQF